MGIDTGIEKLGAAHAGRLKWDLSQTSDDSESPEDPNGPDTPDSPDDPETSDGRRLRRSRNRETVVDALLALYNEENWIRARPTWLSGPGSPPDPCSATSPMSTTWLERRSTASTPSCCPGH